MQMPIFIALVGLIYLVEVLSVIIQVTYFKRPAERGSSRWLRSTITLSSADGPRRELSQYSRSLRQSFAWLPIWDYKHIGGETMSQKVLVAGTGISGISAAKLLLAQGGEVILMMEMRNFPKKTESKI